MVCTGHRLLELFPLSSCMLCIGVDVVAAIRVELEVWLLK